MYFAIAVVLVVCELFSYQSVIYIFKPLLIPTLMVLYYVTSVKRNLWYFFALLFALGSNLFFLSNAPMYLLYGIVAFMVYRILSIVVVVRLVDQILWLPFVIATLPFLFIFSILTE